MPNQKIDKADFDYILALGKDFEQVNFTNCDLQNADFSGFSFEDCTFENCNLSLIQLKNSRVRDNQFKSCKMIGINWTNIDESLNFGNVFTDSVLDMNNFTGLNISHFEAYKCTFKETWFNQSNLTEAILKECDLSGAFFNATNLSKADLRGSFGYMVDPQYNKITKAKFSLPEAVSLLNGFDISLEW
jgi:uncharacterized protein YjbI with pentapeptide repeats